MTLYLKYRPQTIGELDLEKVRLQLEKIFSTDSIPHAFLFAGPKGTGKTSAARIVAKVINCEKPSKNGVPCNTCDQCTSITKGENIDIYELDAASNRGIDDIRTLRESVKLAPASARKKIYIIDEAHMLTTEASNALLKTLEEPPDHVLFILATTNPEKLIGTIRSRTTEITFSKALVSEIAAKLEHIVKAEKRIAEKESLELIAQYSAGSFRDAIKNLENALTTHSKLTKENILSLLSAHLIDTNIFLKLFFDRKTKECIDVIENSVSTGVSLSDSVENLIEELKTLLLAKVGIGEDAFEYVTKDELVRAIELFLESLRQMKNTSHEHIPFEIAVVKWCESMGLERENTKIAKKKSNDEEKVKKNEPETKIKVVQPQTSSQKIIATSKPVDESFWASVLNTIGEVNKSVEALLRSAKPLGRNGNTFNIGVFYTFHKERLEDFNYKTIVEDALSKLLGDHISLECSLTSQPVLEPSASASEVVPETVLAETNDKDIVNLAGDIFS